jgi:hypothetical protein
VSIAKTARDALGSVRRGRSQMMNPEGKKANPRPGALDGSASARSAAHIAIDARLRAASYPPGIGGLVLLLRDLAILLAQVGGADRLSPEDRRIDKLPFPDADGFSIDPEEALATLECPGGAEGIDLLLTGLRLLRTELVAQRQRAVAVHPREKLN